MESLYIFSLATEKLLEVRWIVVCVESINLLCGIFTQHLCCLSSVLGGKTLQILRHLLPLISFNYIFYVHIYPRFWFSHEFEIYVLFFF